MSQCLHISLSWKALHPIEIQMLLFLSTPPLHSLAKSLSLQTLSLLRRSSSTMSTRFQPHAFAGNPIRVKTPKSTDPLSPNSALDTLKSALLATPHDPVSPNFRVLPFRKGRPLAGSGADPAASPSWHLGWLSLAECGVLLAGSEVKLGEDSLVYLGCGPEEDVVYWAIDFSEDSKVVEELGRRAFSFVELRTLMVATDWADSRSMGELAVAGHAKALLEWHASTRYCGQCGSRTVPKEAVDKEELEDAQWHSREDVKKALAFAEYKKAQMTAAGKVDQMCKGVSKGQSLSADFNVESGELAPMFVPGPFAIAHHLISTWVHQGSIDGPETRQTSSWSNL